MLDIKNIRYTKDRGCHNRRTQVEVNTYAEHTLLLAHLVIIAKITTFK